MQCSGGRPQSQRVGSPRHVLQLIHMHRPTRVSVRVPTAPRLLPEDNGVHGRLAIRSPIVELVVRAAILLGHWMPIGRDSTTANDIASISRIVPLTHRCSYFHQSLLLSVMRFHEIYERLDWKRWADQIALDRVAPRLIEHHSLCVGFHSLGHRMQSKRLAQRDDRSHQHSRAPPGSGSRSCTNERSILMVLTGNRIT